MLHASAGKNAKTSLIQVIGRYAIWGVTLPDLWRDSPDRGRRTAL